MPEIGGLQIEARCVKCGRLPTAEISLFELQNHLYICNVCGQEDMKAGKHIALAGGNTLTLHGRSAASSDSGRPASPGRLPVDSLFAVLGLPLTASPVQIREAIKQQMSVWMKRRNDPQQKQMLARLREWQNDLLDEEAFEEQRAKWKQQVQGDIIGLSVGGRMVFSLQEFLDTCEEIKEGWADGERHLRTGELAHWILFQLDNQSLAECVSAYQRRRDFSDFRALNEALYALLPARPFRFYKSEHWQARAQVPTASSPKELADLCDRDWQTGLFHLYRGSLVFWLEHSQGVPGLQAYYEQAVVGYERQYRKQGLGLELLLERAIPDHELLPRPELVVRLDGHPGSCVIANWDPEVPHQTVSVVVNNTTRGFSSLEISLAPKRDPREPDWAVMQPVSISGRPQEGLPHTAWITLSNLSQLKRGHTYIRWLNLSRQGAYGSAPDIQHYPLTLKTMRFYQGLRGKLWLFGLRGNLPGLFWSALPGLLLALLFFQLLPGLFFPWYAASSESVSQWEFLTLCITYLNFILSFSAPYSVWAIAAMAAWAGLCVGFGKGHNEFDSMRGYDARRGAKAFRGWFFWLFAPGAVLALSLLDGDLRALFSGQMAPEVSIALPLAYLVLWLLILLIAVLIAWLRSRLEIFIRRRYASLLDLPGRM